MILSLVSLCLILVQSLILKKIKEKHFSNDISKTNQNKTENCPGMPQNPLKLFKYF